jgi:hypothetical protein
MKVQTGIWVDSGMAVIVCLNDNQEEVYVIESHLENEKRLQEQNGHHNSGTSYHFIAERSREEERIRLEKKHFFEAITEKLGESNIISIFGPDPTKQELKHFLAANDFFCHKAISVQPLGPLPQDRFIWFVRKYYQQVWV